MTTFVLVSLALWLIASAAVWAALMCTEPEPAADAGDAPLPKRRPLPQPSLAELADDMAVIDPATLADMFRRENAHLPR